MKATVVAEVGSKTREYKKKKLRGGTPGNFCRQSASFFRIVSPFLIQAWMMTRCFLRLHGRGTAPLAKAAWKCLVTSS